MRTVRSISAPYPLYDLPGPDDIRFFTLVHDKFTDVCQSDGGRKTKSQIVQLNKIKLISERNNM